MKSIIIKFIFYFLFIIRSYSQETLDSLLIIAKEKQELIIQLNDSILYEKQIKDLKFSLIDDMQYFYDLQSFTNTIYISYFDKKDLEAYAFNPSLLKIKIALSNIKTRFDVLDESYSQSKIISDSNYIDIKSNFLSAYNLLYDKLSNNCNRTEICAEIKERLKESFPIIEKVIIKLNYFIKL